MTARRTLAFAAPVALCLALVATLTARPQATRAAGETFDIDPTHSMALFRVQHLGAGAFWGRLNGVKGTIRHDESSRDGLVLNVAIAIDSVDTGTEALDAHLKTSDFFDAENHPTATFESRSAKRLDTRAYEVTGDLTMRGVTKRITVPVEWVGTRDGGQRGKRCGFETVFTVNRMDYGIDYGPGALGEETRLVIAMEGIKAEE